MTRSISAIIFAIAIIPGCASTSPDTTANNAAEPGNPAVPYYEGDGGKDIRIAIDQPSAESLASSEQHLPRTVQNILISTITTFSAIRPVDNRPLDEIRAELDRAESGYYSEAGNRQIGELTGARLLLTGTILKLSAREFTLQLHIIDLETGEVMGSYTSGVCTVTQLRKNAVQEGAEALLRDLKVTLTDAGKVALLTSQGGMIEAQTAAAQSEAAQQGGLTIVALSYANDAAFYNPASASMSERLKALQGQVSSGDQGVDLRNALARRDQWQAWVDECTNFYRSHLPFNIVYDTAYTESNFDVRAGTIDLSFPIGLSSSPDFKTINILRRGLAATNMEEEWKILWNNPPAFSGSVTVDALLINDTGKVLSTARIGLPSAVKEYGGFLYTPSVSKEVVFKGVKADDILGSLAVKIQQVDRKDAESAVESGYIRIFTPGEYDDYVANYMKNAPIQRQDPKNPKKNLVINYRTYMAIKAWAERHGYTFTQNSAYENGNNRNAALGMNLSFDAPVTHIHEFDAFIWANAYHEYNVGKKNRYPYATAPMFTREVPVKNAPTLYELAKKDEVVWENPNSPFLIKLPSSVLYSNWTDGGLLIHLKDVYLTQLIIGAGSSETIQ
jgi:hypothetical protein